MSLTTDNSKVSRIYNVDNYGFNIFFTIIEKDTGDVKDITGLVPVFKMWISGSNYVYLNGVCTIQDAVHGECTYLIKEGDFDEEGVYSAEIELQADGYIEDTEPFEIILQESSPKPCPISYEVDGELSVVLDLDATTSLE